MSYLKDREIWLSNVPTGNPPVGYFWKFIQNGKVVVRDSSGNNQMMVATSGSQAITGSLTVTEGITGTVSSASYVEYSNVANKPTLVSGSSQVTYSGLTGIPSGIVSGSAQIASFGIFATTGSNGFNGSQSITGSLTVTGQVVAQTLNVQQVTSSVVYSSGSNVFGNELGNTQQFTGSVGVTGSLTVAGAGTFSSTVTSNSFISDGNANEGVIRIERDTVSTNTVIGALNFTNNNGATVYGRVRGGRNSAGDGYVSLGTGVGENLYAIEGGNIGIGTASPESLSNNTTLQIDGTNHSFVRTGTSNYGGYFATIPTADVLCISNVRNPVTGTYSNTGKAASGINLFSESSNGYITFLTTATNNGSPGERMRITSSGRVGIGTDTPGANLHVVRANDGGSGTPGVILSTANGANDIVRFQDGTTTVAVVKNSGNIGIGTASPGERLTIQSSASGTAPQLKLQNPVDSNSSQGAANNLSAGQLLFGATGSFPLTARIESIYGSDASFGRQADLIFSGTNGSGTLSERMRITSGGNVGIGTTTPNGKLTIKAELSDTPSLVFRNELGGPSSAISNFVSAVQTFTVVGTNVYVNSTGNFSRFDTGKESSAIVFDEGLINFTTGPTSAVASGRMRIKSDGRVYVGNSVTVTNNPLFGVIGSGVWDGGCIALSNTGTGGKIYTIFSTNSSFGQGEGNLLFYNATNDFNNLIIYSNGNYDFLGSDVSDVRLKQDIEDLNYGLAEIMQLSPKSYHLKSENNLQGENQTVLRKRYGFIAQEIQQILPDTITGEETETDYLGLDYNGVLAVAIKAIQEQQTLIESLKSRIEILEQ